MNDFILAGVRGSRGAWRSASEGVSRRDLELLRGGRDKLDNRRSNLRAITKAENNHNLPSYRNGGSPFRGVCWNKERGCWRASGQVAGNWTHIGYFASEEEAARAASDWRREHMAYAVEDVAA